MSSDEIRTGRNPNLVRTLGCSKAKICQRICCIVREIIYYEPPVHEDQNALKIVSGINPDSSVVLRVANHSTRSQHLQHSKGLSKTILYLLGKASDAFEKELLMSHSDFQNSGKTNSSFEQSNIVKIIDEEAIIRKFFESDPKEGCKVLFQKYYKILCSHAVRFVYSREIAEDIVSEIFCKFWSDQLYLKVNLSYRAYLFKAVRYSAYNYIRWELSKRKNDVDVADLEEQFKSLRPEDTMLIDELSEEINRTIDNLPAQCKKVFMLSRFENRKYSEIATELGISIKAVEAHISKALETLRAKLKSSDLLTLFFLAYLSGS